MMLIYPIVNNKAKPSQAKHASSPGKIIKQKTIRELFRQLIARDAELASREAEAHDLRRARLARVRFPPEFVGQTCRHRVIFGHPYSHPPTAAPAGSMSCYKTVAMMIKYENESGKLDATR